ncbi:hypothetical protein [Paenibacillus sp. LHD-38]|uniref:hypothetical protein n=1 Tax=Paenibacillus sp. LHD-38 TaxID=3072143 RepID=UPI00280E1780|nr:hypothetical protein [Paenibacillus sp. LHD-38]MDQ8733583.1 hypothetical protein [Paenibacillus sp. LHD-38]
MYRLIKIQITAALVIIVMSLFLQRDRKKLRQFDLQIIEGDKLCVYGNKQEIEEAFKDELMHMQPKRVNEHDMTSMDG